MVGKFFFSPQMSIIIPFNALYECFLIWNSFLALFFPFWHQMECRLPIFLPFSYSDAFNDERRCTLTFSFFFLFYYYQPIGWVVVDERRARPTKETPPSVSFSIFPAPRFHVQKVDDACTSYATTTTTLLFEFSVFFFCPHIMTSSILLLTPNQKKSKVKSLFFFCCCFFNTGRRMYP